MKISRNWLQTYFKEQLPSSEKIAEALTVHAFEIEEVVVVEGDSVLDVKVLPNRAHDCLSHYGIAKEISTILNIPLFREPFKHRVPLEPPSKTVKISVATEKVSRFSLALIRNVAVGPSPSWLSSRLEAIGQKSVNNVVDATNYVMFDLGQPLHAFDADLLTFKNESFHISLKESGEGEKMTTLDKKEETLPREAIVILDGNADTKTILGIAGIKGGKKAEITHKTKNIILEAANFDAQSIRKTSKDIKLRTDASVRFENAIAPELPGFALPEVVKLILEIAGSKETIFEGYAEHYPKVKNTYKTGVSLSEINSLLGTALKKEEVEKIIYRLALPHETVKPKEKIISSAEALLNKPYLYGASVAYDAPERFDCSGLVRYVFAQAGISLPRVAIDQFLYGDEIEADDLKEGDLIFSHDGDTVRHETVVFMAGKKSEKGISHVALYLGEGKILHASGGRGKVIIENLKESPDFKNIAGYRRVLLDEDERFVVSVPFERVDIKRGADIIEEIGRIYGLVNIPSVFKKEAVSFEVNKTFFYATQIRSFLTEAGFSEVSTYAFQDHGEIELQNPLASNKAFMRHSLEDGLTQSLELNARNAPLLGLEEIKVFEIGKVFPKEGEKLSLGIGIYTVGNLKNKDAVTKEKLELVVAELGKNLNVSFKPTYTDNLALIDLEPVFEKLTEQKKYKEFVSCESRWYIAPSQYPFVLRDLAVFVPNEVEIATIEALIKKQGSEILKRLDLFDVFKKEDKTSYAFRCVFQSDEKTLSDLEVNKVMEAVTLELNSKEGFKVR